MSSITDFATLAMAIATMGLAWFTRKSIKSTQDHNRTVDEYNKQTLEVIRASHKPTLFLDLFKKWKGRTGSTLPNNYIYWVTVRNDGMGPAINVKLFHKFARMPSLKPGEGWKSSEKDFELYYRGDWNIGNIAAGKTWRESFWPLEEESSDLNSIYAVSLMANCEDIFGEKNYGIKREIHIDDIKEISDLKEIP